MNAVETSDRSVVFTFYGFEKEELFIVGKDKNDIIASSHVGKPKITFHQSGVVKLKWKMLQGSNEDRITWTTMAFAKIQGPRQMMEIFLPPKLLVADETKYNKERDLMLDATGFPKKQWRITLFCTSIEHRDKLKAPLVPTSECEFSASLEANNLIWTWALRVSSSDFGFSDRMMYFINGNKKWPKDEGLC